MSIAANLDNAVPLYQLLRYHDHGREMRIETRMEQWAIVEAGIGARLTRPRAGTLWAKVSALCTENGEKKKMKLALSFFNFHLN